MTPETPLKKVLGPTAAALETKLDLRTVGDLLRHYPRRYVERGELTSLRELEEGEHVTVMARVRSARARATRNGLHLVEVAVTDMTGELRLSFFYKNAGQAKWRVGSLPEGYVGLFAGRVTSFKGRLQLQHPEVLEDDRDTFLPIYPASEGLDTDKIRKSVRTALDGLDRDDPLPHELREAHGLQPLLTALRGIHQPQDWAQVGAARKRLKWDEAFVLQTFLAQRRHEVQAIGGVPRPGRPGGVRDAFDARLPFTLQPASRRSGPCSTPSCASRTRCTACSRARSARARPSWRCARCSRSSTAAARRPCWPRPRCSPSSTPARCARCSGNSPRRGSSAAPTSPRGWRCSPARSARPPAGRPWARSRVARPASSSARTR